MRSVVLCLALAVSAVAQGEPNRDDLWWPGWRGPMGTGVAPMGDPPIEWSEEKNIRWKVGIPGLGNSSPIVWGSRVYVTTAIETERRSQATGREPQDRRALPMPTVVYEFAVLALDREDGRVVWRTKLSETVPHEGGHANNSHATSSPVTDGERLYVNFGSRGLYCLDMDGRVQWSKDYGLMRTRFQYGEGSSPAMYGDTLVVNWDHEGSSFIVALDKRNGDEIWRHDRDEVTSWSTPIIVPVRGRPQVVINATTASRGYDLVSGETLWSLAGMTVNCIPSPAYGDGIAYVMSGFRGNMLQAIRLSGARGDLEESDSLIWSHARNTSYVASALAYDDFIYFVRSYNGVLSCLDANTGEVHYEGKRLRGLRTVYSSPVGASGRVYLTSREGMTKVIKLGAEFEELATNQLDDGFDATPAIVGDEFYLRGKEFLYCIATSRR